MSKIIPSKIEFAVVSPGGVATTSLIHFLARTHKVNAPNDEDSLKHMPIPPVSFNPNFKYIHVFGDPVAATISLFRRKFQALQSMKLQRGTGMNRPIPLEMSLEEYAFLGKDRLLLENFFENYHSKHLHYPTLFIRYEKLWDNLDAISDFLGIPKHEFAGFPARRMRESEKEPSDPVVISKLKKIYGRLYDKIESLPDVFVQGVDLRKSHIELLFTESFRRAVVNGVTSRFVGFGETYGR